MTQTIPDLDLRKEISVHYYFAAAPPDFAPTMIVNPWYSGPGAEAKVTLKAPYDLGPLADTTEELPYNQINSGTDSSASKANASSHMGAD